MTELLYDEGRAKVEMGFSKVSLRKQAPLSIAA